MPLFTRAASVELLTAMAPGLDAGAAGGLVAPLGDLPLAVEQAAGSSTPPRCLWPRMVGCCPSGPKMWSTSALSL